MTQRLDWSSRFGTLVHDVARLYSRSFDRKARDTFDLTRAQSRVLVNLHRYGVMSQAELAERMDVTPMALVRLLDRLEQKRLVRREVDMHDKRIFRLHISEHALARIDMIAAFGNAVESDALRGLDASERAELTRLLRKVLSNLTDVTNN